MHPPPPPPPDHLLGRTVAIHGASFRATLGSVHPLHRHLSPACHRCVHGCRDGGAAATADLGDATAGLKAHAQLHGEPAAGGYWPHGHPGAGSDRGGGTSGAGGEWTCRSHHNDHDDDDDDQHDADGGDGDGNGDHIDVQAEATAATGVGQMDRVQ